MPARPRPVVADQPGDPGPVQHRLGVQAVRRLVGAAHRADRTPTGTINDTARTRPGRSPEDVCATGVKCVWRNSFCTRHQRPVPLRLDQHADVAGRVERRVLLRASARRSSDARNNHELLQNEICATSASAPTRGSTCRTSSTAACPTTRPKAALVESGVLAEGEEPSVLLGDDDQPVDRPGPARRHADPVGGRLLGASPTAATCCSPRVVRRSTSRTRRRTRRSPGSST